MSSKIAQVLGLAALYKTLASPDLDQQLQQLSQLDTFQDREAFAKKHFKRLSSGSSRIVYQTSHDTVIKLAQNKKGLAQNEV